MVSSELSLHDAPRRGLIAGTTYFNLFSGLVVSVIRMLSDLPHWQDQTEGVLLGK